MIKYDAHIIDRYQIQESQFNNYDFANVFFKDSNTRFYPREWSTLEKDEQVLVNKIENSSYFQHDNYISTGFCKRVAHQIVYDIIHMYNPRISFEAVGNLIFSKQYPIRFWETIPSPFRDRVMRNANDRREWRFYLKRLNDDSLYIGSSTDIRRRNEQHNLGTASHSPCIHKSLMYEFDPQALITYTEAQLIETIARTILSQEYGLRITDAREDLDDKTEILNRCIIE